ncbi:MAG TPA: FHA domain-containing protein [Terriglobales bacterium]|nr:FHA domain-containing protein [Terriglobales bacterium]
MAKLFLKFEQATLKEYALPEGGSVTIGRLPDNSVQIDNLAVSGHHARIGFEGDHFVIEDSNSLNGTFVNGRRINKAVLNDGDVVLVGKHTIAFQDEARSGVALPPLNVTPPVPQLDATVMLETKQAKEMLAQAVPGEQIASRYPIRERIATLTVMEGKTDQTRYVLSSKLNVIGKSEMASIKLKGWFAPRVAAVINHRDDRYFIAASEKDVRIKVNGAEVAGQKELAEGDVVEVAGVKLTFAYSE